MAYLKYFEC